MKKANNFQIAKVQPQSANICLIFYQFQPGITYKGVAYKKSCISSSFIGKRKVFRWGLQRQGSIG